MNEKHAESLAQFEALLNELGDACGKTYFFNVTKHHPPGVEWLPFVRPIREKVVAEYQRLLDLLTAGPEREGGEVLDDVAEALANYSLTQKRNDPIGHRLTMDLRERFKAFRDAFGLAALASGQSAAGEGWIPVSERLPEVGEWAIVLTDTHAGCRPDLLPLLPPKPRFAVVPARLRMVDEEGNPTWERWQLSSGSPVGILDGDTHWRPLPAAPAAQAKEEGRG